MPKVIDGFSLEQIYDFYLEQVKKESDKFQLTKAQFKDIVIRFNKKLVERVLNGSMMKFPAGLGHIRIRKTETDLNNLKVDYGHLNKTGERIYHLNEHSDGFKARWYWNKQNIKARGARSYAFVPTWTNKRRLSQEMKKLNGHTKYLG